MAHHGQFVRPDGLRRSKRSSDHSSLNDTMRNKRPKGEGLILSFRPSDQLVLRAAAEILNTPLDRILSLANVSRSTSSNIGSDSVEEVSNLTSNEPNAEFNTPPDSLDDIYTGEPLETFELALGNQGSSSYPGAANFNETQTSHVESYSTQPGQDAALHGIGAGMETDLTPFLTTQQSFQFATSPDSQYTRGHLVIPNQMPSVNDNILENNQGWSGQEWMLDASLLGLPPNQDYQQFQPRFMQERSQDHSFGQAQPSDGRWKATEQSGYKIPEEPGSSMIPRRVSEPLQDNSNDNVDTAMKSQGVPIQLKDEKPRQSSIQKAQKIPGAKGRRRGPFASSEKREETALTRKLGACIRCSMQRVKCKPDPNNLEGCCKTCISAARTWTRWLPCLRYKITDSELLDNAKAPRPTWTTRWKKMELTDVTNWADDEVKMIQVTQEVGSTSYWLCVRKFIPVEGDALARSWFYNGVRYDYECAPYAVNNMREAGGVLAKFMSSTLATAIPFWLKNDKILLRTYSMAFRYSRNAEREEDRTLLKYALRLWAASRMMSRSAFICGQETLGMQKRDFGPGAPSTNKVLLPPVFSAQMEIIFVAMIMEPTKKEILNRLKTLIQDNSPKRRAWLAIYLCIFMLLHSCALLTARDHERAKLQGVSSRYYRPAVIDELHNGAKILLAYFHYSNSNRGSYPLHMDWMSEDQVALAELKEDQINFMRETVKDYAEKTSHFQYILANNVYEDEYYFIAQLYERDWKPRHTV